MSLLGRLLGISAWNENCTVEIVWVTVACRSNDIRKCSIIYIIYLYVIYILVPRGDAIININNKKCAKALKPRLLSDSLQCAPI